MLSEETLIDRYFGALGAIRSDVALGVGDDAALLEPPAGRQLVAAVDTLNEGVHFPPGLAPAAIGHRLLAVNLSDLAAMGATPAWATLSLSLPEPGEDWLAGFAGGLAALAERHGVALVGGDTVRGPLSLSLQLLGSVPAGAALMRSAARPGDAIYLTGQTGIAAGGLRALQADAPPGPLTDAFLWPEPRVTAGRGLRGIASAAIDLSDGLVTDLARLLAASGVGGRLEVDRLPLAAALMDAVGGDEARRLALTGGDDYELCFTVPPAAEAKLGERAPTLGVSITRVGVVEPEAGLRLIDPPSDLPAGWQHFAEGAR